MSRAFRRAQRRVALQQAFWFLFLCVVIGAVLGVAL